MGEPRPLKVAWFPYFPVEWLPDPPPELRDLPRQHPATWQRILWDEFKTDPRLSLDVLVPRSQFPRSFMFERDGTRFHCLRTPPGLRAATLYWLDTVLIRIASLFQDFCLRMLIRELDDKVLAAFIHGNYFGCLDRQLRELTLLDLLLELRQVDICRVLGAGVNELVNEERARDDQQPKDDLPCGRTQNLPASVSHNSLITSDCPFQTVSNQRLLRCAFVPGRCPASTPLDPPKFKNQR